MREYSNAKFEMRTFSKAAKFRVSFSTSYSASPGSIVGNEFETLNPAKLVDVARRAEDLN